MHKKHDNIHGMRRNEKQMKFHVLIDESSIECKNTFEWIRSGRRYPIVGVNFDHRGFLSFWMVNMKKKKKDKKG